MNQPMTAHLASCALLHATHDVRHHSGNRAAFLFRAQLARTPEAAESERRLADWSAQKLEAAQTRVSELQQIIAESAEAFV